MKTVVLVGHPNTGKTSLFNALTQGKAKVGNYPGVTVERREGFCITRQGTLKILDLPGCYSLVPRTPDEQITRDILLGHTEDSVDLCLVVLDACHLERSLSFLIEIRELGLPAVVAFNRIDLAQKKHLAISAQSLMQVLEIPVIPTIASSQQGIPDLIEALLNVPRVKTTQKRQQPTNDPQKVLQRWARVDQLMAQVCPEFKQRWLHQDRWTEAVDRLFLHPFWGSFSIFMLLLILFQMIFNWAQIPMDWIKTGFDILGNAVFNSMQPGPLRSLLVDGILSSVGSVVVFLPQILFLFTFLFLLEDSGILSRIAFLMDRSMGKVGLQGRAFIPLLSSLSCAIPGIMATRTIENHRDRLTTILAAPFMTCSARLPVYSLLIAAFIPNQTFWGPLKWQGMVMGALYLLGVIFSLLLAWGLRKSIFRGPNAPLLMELPLYQWPNFRNLWIGLWERTRLFLYRAGTVILSVSLILWFFSSYPKGPTPETTLEFSFVGQLGRFLEPVFRPLGFHWKIVVALIPGLMAREVMIGALATVYALDEKQISFQILSERIAQEWSLPTAMSLLVWYVFSCQCMSTLVVVRRETQSLYWPIVLFLGMTLLAYGASWVTYQGMMRWI